MVFGESLIDVVVTPADPRDPQPAGIGLTGFPGGGPFNVAISLGRLGTSVGFVSRVSRDHLGTKIIDALTDAGVDTTWTQRGDEPTPLAMASIGADGSASYSFYVSGTADRLFAAPELPVPRIASFGTLSLVLEPGAAEYRHCLVELARSGAVIVLDPNIRPQVIEQPDAFRTSLWELLPYVSVLKLSDEDADWLGISATVALGAGAQVVVKTRGGHGLSARSALGRVEVPAAQASVVDTIGAGDTVHGALLHWLDRAGATRANVAALDWAAGLDLAARAAAVTVSRAGANPPWANELE